MISRPYIAQWRKNAPWKEFAQVEQDLIISRALVAIFQMIFKGKPCLPGRHRPT